MPRAREAPLWKLSIHQKVLRRSQANLCMKEQRGVDAKCKCEKELVKRVSNV
jgi:hypothetical protein